MYNNYNKVKQSSDNKVAIIETETENNIGNLMYAFHVYTETETNNNG